MNDAGLNAWRAVANADTDRPFYVDRSTLRQIIAHVDKLIELLELTRAAAEANVEVLQAENAVLRDQNENLAYELQALRQENRVLRGAA